MNSTDKDCKIWQWIKEQLKPEKVDEISNVIEQLQSGTVELFKECSFKTRKQRYFANLIQSSLSTGRKASWAEKYQLYHKLKNLIIKLDDYSSSKIENKKDPIQFFNQPIVKKIIKDANLEKEQKKETKDYFSQLCFVIVNGANLLHNISSFKDLEKELKQRIEKNNNIVKNSILQPFNVAQMLADWDGLKGIGPALACDFLKNTGLANLAKPDTHIRDVFSIIDGIPYSLDLVLAKRVYIFAQNACPPQKDKPYETGAFYVDKVIWTICKDDKKTFLEKLAQHLDKLT